MTQKKTLTTIRKIISVAFILGIAFSFNLWHSERLFPLIPVFDILSDITITVNYLVLILLSSTLTIIFFSANRVGKLATLGLTLFLTLQDQMRLQPWVYMYFLMLIPFLFKDYEKLLRDKITYFQLLLIGVYLWGGIHKLNPMFVDHIFRSVLVDLFKIPNETISDNFLLIGYGIPVIEILIGVGLIFPKTRKITVLFAISTHLFILLYINAFGALSNSVVFPWNIAMILLAYLLFYKNSTKIVILKSTSKSIKLTKISIIILVGILPALNFINKWDTYLSFSVYSGKPLNYYVLIDDETLQNNNLSEYQPYFKEIAGMKGGKILDITLWTFKEMNVPFNPEPRIFKSLSQQLCNESATKNHTYFMASEYPLWDRYLYSNSTNVVSELEFLKFERPLTFSNYQLFSCTDIGNN